MLLTVPNKTESFLVLLWCCSCKRGASPYDVALCFPLYMLTDAANQCNHCFHCWFHFCWLLFLLLLPHFCVFCPIAVSYCLLLVLHPPPPPLSWPLLQLPPQFLLHCFCYLPMLLSLLLMIITCHCHQPCCNCFFHFCWFSFCCISHCWLLIILLLLAFLLLFMLMFLAKATCEPTQIWLSQSKVRVKQSKGQPKGESCWQWSWS